VSRFSRRELIKAVGAGLLLAPFLGRRRAHAASPARVRRVFLLCTMGTNPDLWRPRNPTTDIFNVSTDPLAAIKDHLILVDGLMSSDPGENHGSPEALTGKGFADNAKVSVDQYLAQHVTQDDPFPALLLGAKTSGGVRMFWDDKKGGNLSTIDSPIDAYGTIFAGAAGGGVPADQIARNKSILDVGLDETSALAKKLGAGDRAKLELYAQAIRDAEKKLVVPPGTAPTPPTQDGSNLVAADLAHIDLAIAAMASSLTRVVGLQVGSDQSIQIDTKTIDNQPLQGEVHGGFIHGGAGNGYKQLVQWEQKVARDYFVYVCNKLAALPEADGNGTLFDNTLVVWARDMGDSVTHNQNSFPFVLACGSNAYLKTAPGGRYVHYNSSTLADRHERLLLNILVSMGVTSFAGFGKLTGGDQTPLAEIAG
jgi:Protein of unknown function (DUF1552)